MKTKADFAHSRIQSETLKASTEMILLHRGDCSLMCNY